MKDRTTAARRYALSPSCVVLTCATELLVLAVVIFIIIQIS